MSATSEKPAAHASPAAATDRRRMIRLGRLTHRGAGVAAILCIGFAAASLIQPLGWNQTSHQSLVQALDSGTASIDPYQRITGDKVLYHGHWYSPRAPGLAFATLPAYEGLELTGFPHTYRSHVSGRNNSELLWALGIWGATIPAVLLLLLVRWVANRVEPGFGTPAAVTLGLGTLVLPFSTVLFSHVLSALLGFAAFALLFRERDQAAGARLWPYALAGACAGYAVTTEYALVLVGVVVGAYAISRGDRLRRGGAYLAGAVAGVIPLALYNNAVFGSFSHVGYADVPNQRSGFFGVHLPRPAVAVELLFSSRGLLTLGPVVVLGAAGTWLMYRRGYRREAGVIAAIAVAFLTYSSGYFLPFGGAVPGPRFLIATLPFLCFPLALAYRRWPGPTIALAAVSIVALGIPTVTRPLPGGETDVSQWVTLLENPHLSPTFLSILGVHSQWAALIPTLAATLLALTFAVRSTPRLVLAWRSAAAGALVAGGWAAFAILAPNLLGIDRAAAKTLTADKPHAHVRGVGTYQLVDHALISLGAGLLALLTMRLVSVLRERRAGISPPAPGW